MTIFEQIDAALRAKGWRYDRGNELFMAGERVLEWEKLVCLLPGLTLDELASYQDDRHDDLRSRRANGWA
jgi:hypothetical protein